MGRQVIRVALGRGTTLLALAALAIGPLSYGCTPGFPSSGWLIGRSGEGGEVTATPLEGSAGGGGEICFWSAQGPMCVGWGEGVRVQALGPEGLVAALLEGPTAEQEARGMWSAIPEGTELEDVEVQADRSVVVRFRMEAEALGDLDHENFEVIVSQVGSTLEPLGWRELRIETWDPSGEEFVPLAAFLPKVPAPRKETVVVGEERPGAAAYTRQLAAGGEGQPEGALSGKTVYVSAGHGWQWNGYAWRTQRPPYPTEPYDTGSIIEDHNNAEAVNQYLLEYLWNAGAEIWPVRERDMNEASVIVNNDALGSGNGFSEHGEWYTGNLAGYDLEQAGQTYRHAVTVDGTATAIVTWTAKLPADGKYAVYAWYRSGSNRAPDARYTVHHAGGETAVVVDQRDHGLTWHYIGTYGFRGEEEARVTLTNQSSAAGQTVIADAVRFGGGTFDDLAGIETTADNPPYKPWWEVATFYYAQRMGIDPTDWTSYNDVTARPIYARWEHAGTGDDAVYVAWHTNGRSGYQWDYSGTETYAHNDCGSPRTEGSLELREAIHTEVVHDIRAGWDPEWVDRGQKLRNLGELRLLWDEDPTVRMPGALIEVAYHDHPDDTDALKEPPFERLVARAICQGIVKYFEQRDGIDLAELPEPPTHLAAQNVGGGEVRISWQAPSTDTEGLVGGSATGYRVYTSTNGVGWSDGLAVEAASCRLSGLPPEEALFVRVAATNEGGESLPTETLGVRVGGNAGVLLVSGFDRLNRTMLVPDNDPVEGYNVRMLLDRLNRYDYAIHHGEAVPYALDSASNEAVRDGLVDLSDYALVDWILGEESAADETLDATERVLLAEFLGSGGALFLSGTEVGWHLDDQGVDPAFYNTHLRADFAGDDADTYEVSPAAAGIFDGLGSFRFDAPGEYDADYADQLTSLNGSSDALVYEGGAGGTAAVQYADGCERLVYFGFPFETIWPDMRPAVMARVLDFLGECAEQPLETTITSPVTGTSHVGNPDFRGTASGSSGVEQVEVAVCRQADDLCWDGEEWGTDVVWLTASGTTNWTHLLPPLEEGMYDVEARARDSGGWADDTPAGVSFRVVVLDEAVYVPLVMRGEERTVCSEVVVNGGFETDEGWTANHVAYVGDVAHVHSGSQSVRLGIPPGEPGGGTSSYSSVRQRVTLPAGSTAVFRLRVYAIGEGNDPGDLHNVGLIDEEGAYHPLNTATSDTGAWEQWDYDVSSYLGQTVTLYIGTLNDGDSDTAAMYVDDVVVEVCP